MMLMLGCRHYRVIIAETRARTFPGLGLVLDSALFRWRSKLGLPVKPKARGQEEGFMPAATRAY
jgi:hypothetical protein